LFAQSEAINDKGFWLTWPSLDKFLTSLRAVLVFGGWRFRWLTWIVLAFALLGSFSLRKKPLVLVALWMFTVLGPGLLLLASLKQPIFMPRLFLWSAIPIAVLVGVGLATPKWASVRVVCLVAFFGLAGAALVRGYYISNTKPRWREAVHLLSRVSKQRDARILAIARREKRLLQYYMERQTDPVRSFPYVFMEGSSAKELEDAIRGAGTIWTVQGHDAPMGREIKARLKQLGRRDQHASFGGDVEVDSFAMPVEGEPSDSDRKPRGRRNRSPRP
jgi:hypothetical protein